MTARRADLAGLPDWPALMSAEQAAAYLGMSPESFEECVRRKVFPPPAKLPIRRRLWHRAALDAALAKRSPQADDWNERKDAWRRRQDRAAGAR